MARKFRALVVFLNALEEQKVAFNRTVAPKDQPALAAPLPSVSHCHHRLAGFGALLPSRLGGFVYMSCAKKLFTTRWRWW
jgi:hypothetical protein